MDKCEFCREEAETYGITIAGGYARWACFDCAMRYLDVNHPSDNPLRYLKRHSKSRHLFEEYENASNNA